MYIKFLHEIPKIQIMVFRFMKQRQSSFHTCRLSATVEDVFIFLNEFTQFFSWWQGFGPL